jgi:hypothetical protein
MWSCSSTENNDSIFDSSMIFRYRSDFASVALPIGKEDGCLDKGISDISSFGAVMKKDRGIEYSVGFPAGVYAANPASGGFLVESLGVSSEGCEIMIIGPGNGCFTWVDPGFFVWAGNGFLTWAGADSMT